MRELIYTYNGGFIMEKQIDISLVTAAMNGDENAFRTLYELTYNDKYYIAKKYMKNDIEAEDVIQESYMKIWQYLPSLSEPKAFFKWTSKIVANTAITALNKNHPVLFSDMDTDDKIEEYEIEDSYEGNQPELSFSTQEEQQIIREIIDALSDEQRLCIIMFYIEDMSIKEIAEIIGCSENTVKSRLNYGKKNIKAKVQQLQKKGYDFRGIPALTLLLMFIKKEAFSMGVYIPAESKAYTAVKEVNDGVISKPAGATAKVSFIKSAAGKLIIALSSLALITAIAVLIIIFNPSQKSQKLKPEAATSSDAVTSDLSDYDDNTKMDTTEILGIEIDTEAILTEYLENVLIADLGIYDPLQTTYYVGPGHFDHYDYSYDKEAKEMTAIECRVDSPDDLIAEAESLNYTYDYSGIYSYDIYDYDNDGQSELLIIYGNTYGEFGTNNYSRDIIAELYKVTDGKVSLVISKALYNTGHSSYDELDDYSFHYLTGGITQENEVRRIIMDGKPCLLIRYAGARQTDSGLWVGYSVISVMDNMQEIKTLDIHNSDTSEVEITEKNLITNEESVSTADFNSITDFKLNHIDVRDEYLSELGYLDNAYTLFYEDLAIYDKSGFADKYYFSQLKEDSAEETSVVNTVDSLFATNDTITFTYYDSPNYRQTFTVNSNGTFNYMFEEYMAYKPDVYLSEATGSFTILEMPNEYTIHLRADNIVDIYDEHSETEYVEDYGMDATTYYQSAVPNVTGTYYLYLPGTPTSELPQGIAIGGDSYTMGNYNYSDSSGKLNCYLLYKEGDYFIYMESSNQ